MAGLKRNRQHTKTVGPNRSSKLPWPLFLIAAALQWKVTSAYNMVPIATNVKRPADIRPTRSPKFSSPTASPPRMTVKLSQERNVRSFAKNTFNFQGQLFRRLALGEQVKRPWAQRGWEEQCACLEHSVGEVERTLSCEMCEIFRIVTSTKKGIERMKVPEAHI